MVRAASDDHNPRSYTRVVNVNWALPVAGAIVLLGVGAWMAHSGPPSPSASPEPTPSATLRPAEQAPVEVVFTRMGPRKADLLLRVEGRADIGLGPLEVAPNGHVMGEALVKLPIKTRGVALRRVVLKVPAGLDPRVAQAVQTLLIRSGAGSAEIASVSSQ